MKFINRRIGHGIGISWTECTIQSLRTRSPFVCSDSISIPVISCCILLIYGSWFANSYPRRLAREDAEAITIPHVILAAPTDNKEGGVDAYAEVAESRGGKWVVETYDKMFHGWMAGRAKLSDEENAREYERAYNQVAEFFAKNF